MLMKKTNETIGNRARDLPACSSVPHPTAPPRTVSYSEIYVEKPEELRRCNDSVRGCRTAVRCNDSARGCRTAVR